MDRAAASFERFRVALGQILAILPGLILAFIILLASPFAFMWTRLAKSGKEPSSVGKFAIGMVLA